MYQRSRIHMLTVAAARLESDYANPKLVADLRQTANEFATAKAEGRGYTDADEKRIDRQRTLFAFLPSANSTDRFKAAMMQRAYDLMWEGMCTECDALLEFLPVKDADKVLQSWENDQLPNSEKTSFYEGLR